MSSGKGRREGRGKGGSTRPCDLSNDACDVLAPEQNDRETPVETLQLRLRAVVNRQLPFDL